MQSGLSSLQSGFTLLSTLEESDLEWIFKAGKEQKVLTGAVIVTEGVRGEFIYFLLDGLLAVSSAALGGREIARLGPGQIFGEMSFLEDRPTSATISALEDSHILAVARPELETKLAADAGLAARIYKALAILSAERLRELLGTLARWMEAGDRLPVSPEVMERWQRIANRTQQFKEAIVRTDKGEANAPDGAALATSLREFSKFMTAAIGDASPETADAREELGARIQRELLPYFLKSATAERLYKKPRGYPGDYAALMMIAANQPAGSNRLGTMLDHAFLDLPAIRAVRRRRESLATEIARTARTGSGPLRITGIGCGAGDPLFDALAVVPDKLRIHGTIIDFDPHALTTATARRGALLLSSSIQLLRTDVIHLASGRETMNVEAQDLIYSLTVADYLDDRLLLRFLNQAYRKLRPGGSLLISSFHPGNPDRAFLEHVIDWKAAHRSEADMNAVLKSSSFQAPATRFTLDDGGVTFLTASRKPG